MPVDFMMTAAAGLPQAGATAGPAGAASAADTDRFAAMMNPVEPVARSGAPAMGHEPVRAASGVSSDPAKKVALGDAILRSLDSAGHAYTEGNRSIAEVLDAGGARISGVDLLKIQMEVVKSSIAAELVGKGISMATKHVDQLTKLQ